MTFVVDASVTLAWCFEDESSERADRVRHRLASEDAIVPSIWPLEVANGLRSAERRNRVAAGELPGLRQLLSALPIRVEPISLDAALSDVLEMARALELTAYDAAYLALAVRRGLPLATVDERLRDAAERAGIELLG